MDQVDHTTHLKRLSKLSLINQPINQLTQDLITHLKKLKSGLITLLRHHTTHPKKQLTIGLITLLKKQLKLDHPLKDQLKLQDPYNLVGPHRDPQLKYLQGDQVQMVDHLMIIKIYQQDLQDPHL